MMSCNDYPISLSFSSSHSPTLSIVSLSIFLSLLSSLSLSHITSYYFYSPSSSYTDVMFKTKRSSLHWFFFLPLSSILFLLSSSSILSSSFPQSFFLPPLLQHSFSLTIFILCQIDFIITTSHYLSYHTSEVQQGRKEKERERERERERESRAWMTWVSLSVIIVIMILLLPPLQVLKRDRRVKKECGNWVREQSSPSLLLSSSILSVRLFTLSLFLPLLVPFNRFDQNENERRRRKLFVPPSHSLFYDLSFVLEW